ncbi:MAG: hypothetical protein JWO82_460 [Akkermansiaceae bacterium]|nr:hypothetical protein [Akkermansiaceae bacterium]
MHTEQIKRRRSRPGIFLRALALTAGLLALNSCSTLNLLGRDVRAMDQDTRLVGRITGSQSKVVKVFVLKKGSGAEGYTVADCGSPNGMGDFAFLLPGRKPYFVAAVQGGGERLSLYGGHEMREIPPGKDSQATPLLLNLARSINRKDPAVRPLDHALESWDPGQAGTSGAVAIGCGELASLDDAAFDDEAGLKGLWAPVTSVKRHGMGVYFLEPYDPKKIPVLFVHGLGGTARCWQPLIDSLDHRRYQAWVYSYPSGLPLEAVGKALGDLTDRLQKHYGFRRLHVVAHSMGGLVARRAVQRIGNEIGGRYVSSLTTISTPWNGVLFTVVGTLGLPAPVPAWFDLRPNSRFIRQVLEDPLPVPHLLISTDKARFNITLPCRNDGTVAVASQLDPRAVSQAAATCVVHEDHTRVLEVAETKRALAGFLRRES